jgi:hypothetical protein
MPLKCGRADADPHGRQFVLQLGKLEAAGESSLREQVRLQHDSILSTARFPAMRSYEYKNHARTVDRLAEASKGMKLPVP